MKTAILYIYLLQYGYHFRLSQKTSANTSGQFADLSTGSSILKQISYNLRLPAKRMIKAVKIQTILSWNIPVGDKYLFLLAQRNLFYQIYPLHSEITQRISHKKNKTTHKYFIVLLGVSHLGSKNVSIKSFKHLVFIIQSSKSPVIKTWNHMKLRT